MGLFTRSAPPMTPENTRVVAPPLAPATAHRREILETYERAAEAEKRAEALLRIAQINAENARDAVVEAEEVRRAASSRLRAVAEGRV